MLKFILLLLPFLLNANHLIYDKSEEHNLVEWINTNPLLFDYIIITVVLIILLLIYTQYINKQLAQKQNILEETLSELQAQKLALDEHTIVSITDVKGNIIYVNDKFLEISGFSREELIGQNHKILNSGQHDSLFWKNMYETVSKGKVWKNGNICNLKKDGNFYWVDTSIVPIMKNSKPISYIAVRTDITESKEIEFELEQLYEESQTMMKEKETLLKQVEKLAYYDALTGIPNRLSLIKSFEKVLASAQRNGLKLSVMFLDLDGFKLINDTLDHDAGDRVLKEVATILQSTLRRDDLYGRLGGDEFIIVTSGVEDLENIQKVCEKLLTAINTIELPKELKNSFGASIGVIRTIPNQSTTTEALLKEADKLMYSVKKKDKNNFLIQEIAQ